MAMETLHRFWELHRRVADRIYQPGTAHLTRDNLETLLGKNDTANVASWRAVEKLLQRPWWSRAWIVQEATIDEKRTWIFCGGKKITSHVLGALRDLYFALSSQRPVPGFEFLTQNVAFFDTILGMYNFGTARRRLPGGCPLLQLVSNIRTSKATDEKDKIWSMVRFALDFDDECPISPTAARLLSTKQLYTAFKIWYLSNYKDLEILGHCSSNGLELPSWAPDWSHQASSIFLPPRTDVDVPASAPVFCASGPFKLSETPQRSGPGLIQDIKVLRLQGLRVASVSERLPLDRAIIVTEYQTGIAWEYYGTTGIQSPTGCPVNEIFARTLVADCRKSYTGSS